jgi:methylmalonyl-CoA mutase
LRETPEHISLKTVYGPEDARDIDSGFPGLPPFTRGPYATMYAGRPWTIRQYAGFSTAEESNAFYRRNLAAGQKGLSVAFDLATHRGYDSDNPRVAGDVGMAGVAIDSVEDMKLLFDGIPLDQMSVSMTMNGAVLPVMAFFIVAGEEQGVAARQADRHDPERHPERVRGPQHLHLPARAQHADRRRRDRLLRGEMPKFNSISISGYHMHEAGATAVQELAYTLADGMEYVRAAKAKGLDIDSFAPRLSFFFGIGMNLFMEVAKLRAARTLWARIMTDLGAQNEKSKLLRTHCQTSGVSLTEQDPYNNIVRTTIEALAAVLGGTQSLHTNSFDEAIALPTDFSARIARNTQLILAEESGVTAVADPLGGSWYVERLTRELEEKAWELIEEVEAHGGMTKAVAEGLPKQRIEEAAAERAAKVDTGETVIVGVNRYRLPEESQHDILEVDNARVRSGQIARIEKVRASRDEEKVRAALEALESSAPNSRVLSLSKGSKDVGAGRPSTTDLRSSAQDERNLLGAGRRMRPRPLHSWRDFRRSRAGVRPLRHRAQPVRGIYGKARGDDRWKAAEEGVQSVADRLGRKPRILVAKMGQDGHDRGANLVSSAFTDLGFEVIPGPLFQTPRETAEMAVEKDVDVVGASSLAAGHRTLIPEMIERSERPGPSRHQGRRRRGHTAAGLCGSPRRRRAGDLRPGNQPCRRGRRGASPARPQPPPSRRGCGMILALLLLATAVPAVAGDPEETACFEREHSQQGMNRCAAEAFERADANLNLQFRDAHCEYEGLTERGGSLEPLVVSQCMTRLTRERINQLSADEK